MEYHHQTHLHVTRDNTHTQGITPDQLLNTTRTGIDITGQDHSCTPTDIEVTVTITHTEVVPDHITDVTTEAL